MNVPERFAAPCEQCGELLDVRAEGVAQFSSGWAVNRQQGGTNALACQERLPRWLCRLCLDKRRSGFVSDQMALFG